MAFATRLVEIAPKIADITSPQDVHSAFGSQHYFPSDDVISSP